MVMNSYYACYCYKRPQRDNFSHLEAPLSGIETELTKKSEKTEIMKTSTVVLVSSCILLVLASIYETSEGFVISITAKRDQLRKEKLKERKLQRRLKKLINKETEVENRLKNLREWVNKQKSNRTASKVSQDWLSSTTIISS